MTLWAVLQQAARQCGVSGADPNQGQLFLDPSATQPLLKAPSTLISPLWAQVWLTLSVGDGSCPWAGPILPCGSWLGLTSLAPPPFFRIPLPQHPPLDGLVGPAPFLTVGRLAVHLPVFSSGGGGGAARSSSLWLCSRLSLLSSSIRSFWLLLLEPLPRPALRCPLALLCLQTRPICVLFATGCTPSWSECSPGTQGAVGRELGLGA